jgi:putative ABC transport system substrate-binding protein
MAERVRRVGVLMGASPDNYTRSNVAVFEEQLRSLGWRVGTDVIVEVRWGGGDPDRLRAMTTELVRLNPNVFLATGFALPSIAEASHTIPIVFVVAGDALAERYAGDFARPRGNVTGFTNYESTLVGKRLTLLKGMAPNITRVAFLHSGRNTGTLAQLPGLIDMSAAVGVEVVDGAVENEQEIERIGISLASKPNTGLLVASDAFAVAHRELIIRVAEHHHFPAIYPFDFFTRTGGLLSYGLDQNDQFRQAASYVDRLLKGAKPADLPVQTPTKFKLAINLKTANALGLTVPASILATADEVIE